MTGRTSALPLALLFAGLVLYASLYPFTGWRVQGVEPWSWLWAPWPQYWTGFDLSSNLLGYVPLGFLMALVALRRHEGRGTWGAGVGLPAVISLAVECLQTFLPARVPSNVDFVLNTAGAAGGCALAVLLERLGGLRHWSRVRDHWLEPGAHGSLVLLALWPVALLYPQPVPFGLGQVWQRLVEALTEWFSDTPFVDWLPDAYTLAWPLSPLAEAFCVALCLLIPVLLAFGDLRAWRRRAVALAVLGVVAVAAACLSAVLTYGPGHEWAWTSPQVALGLALALVGALGTLALPRRLCHALMVLCLGISLTLLNRVPEVPYFAQTLQAWEQGRFIRFHGLTQWLGWLWPYAALLFGLRAVARPPASPAADRRR